LTLWSWGDWGDFNDRIVGHPKSIDAICKLDEDTICTGSSDGLIRYVQYAESDKTTNTNSLVLSPFYRISLKEP
jgi:hypothetical protein